MKKLWTIVPFRRLLAGWTVGNFADSVLFLTLAIWVKDLTGSSSAAAMTYLALGLPVVLSPLIGWLADAMSRKRLLVLGNLLGAFVAASLVLVTGASQVWLIYLVTFFYGALGYLNSSAQGGLVRDMVPQHDLGDANGLLVTIDQGFRVVTPGLGAGLYVLFGGRGLALAVAAMLLLSALLLLRVQVTESEIVHEPREGGGRVMAGLRHLRTVPILVRMMVTVSIAFAVVGVFETVVFELVDKGLGAAPAFVGVLMMAQGAGSVVGGLTASAVLRRLGALKAQGVGLGVFGLAGLALALPSQWVPLLPVALVACFAGGVGLPWMVVAILTTRQRHTPPRLQGRVGAAMNVAMTVPQLASIALGAALATVVDYRIMSVVAGATLVACAVSLIGSRLVEPPVPDEGATVGGADAVLAPVE